MSVVKYIALREIPATGFAVTGSDISASSADNSFNSTSTDLSGLTAGQWIYVNAGVNSGYHQVASDSTTNKIITNSTLATEAAGTSTTITGYVRGYGVEYTLDFGTQTLDPIEKDVFTDAKAQDGSIERSFKRTEEGWNVMTNGIALADQAQFREFQHSVKTGEIFTFDAYGTVSAADNEQTVKLTFRQPPRRMASSRLMQYGFQVMTA